MAYHKVLFKSSFIVYLYCIYFVCVMIPADMVTPCLHRDDVTSVFPPVYIITNGTIVKSRGTSELFRGKI